MCQSPERRTLERVLRVMGLLILDLGIRSQTSKHTTVPAHIGVQPSLPTTADGMGSQGLKRGSSAS